MYDDTTMNRWLLEPGPITLRRTERKPGRDLRPARGIVIAALAGLDLAILVYLLVRWLG